MMKTFVQPLAALMTAVFAAGTSLAAEKVIFLGAHPDDSEGYAGTAFLRFVSDPMQPRSHDTLSYRPYKFE